MFTYLAFEPLHALDELLLLVLHVGDVLADLVRVVARVLQALRLLVELLERLDQLLILATKIKGQIIVQSFNNPNYFFCTGNKDSREYNYKNRSFCGCLLVFCVVACPYLCLCISIISSSWQCSNVRGLQFQSIYMPTVWTTRNSCAANVFIT